MSGPLLAPSEIVVLRGSEFVASTDAPGAAAHAANDASVNAEGLASAAIAAAVLANERDGVLRLSVRVTKKSLFKTLRGLFSESGDTPAAWPGESLEAKLAAAQGPRSSTALRYLIRVWLAEDTSDPWIAAIDLIHAGLAARGLVRIEAGEGGGGAPARRYQASDALAAALASQPAEPIQGLLAECRQRRPEVWQMLVHDVREGVEERRVKTKSQERAERLADIGRDLADG